MKHLSLLVVVVLSGCGRSEAPKPVAPKATPDNAPAPEHAPKAPASAKPGPLSVAMHVERSSDGIGLRVINGGEQPLALAPDVSLERVTGSAKEPRPEKLTLRFDCKSQGCVTLAPGAELSAPPWLGSASSERCDALLPRQPAGEYRLVVRSCDGRAEAGVSFVELAE